MFIVVLFRKTAGFCQEKHFIFTEQLSHVSIPVDRDVHSVKAGLDSGEIVLIDCREPSEWEIARIEGSHLFPLSQWMDSIDKLSQFQGRQIVVYCHHGGRSLRVTHWMRMNGFPDTQNMAGGIEAWSLQVDDEIPRY